MSNISRVEYNKSLSLIKKLILTGYNDDCYRIIQEHMLYIRDHMVPDDYRTLGEFVRNSYTDDVDTKELNTFIRTIKVNED